MSVQPVTDEASSFAKNGTAAAIHRPVRQQYALGLALVPNAAATYWTSASFEPPGWQSRGGCSDSSLFVPDTDSKALVSAALQGRRPWHARHGWRLGRSDRVTFDGRFRDAIEP
jgi:hypothetical protein